jgi:ABC-2 type transport system ATP-binding protein
MSLQLEATELVKTYKAGRRKPLVRALDGLSLDAEAGTILALLGPNGAGKSTTVKILSTLSKADSGCARVAGVDVESAPEQVRALIGLVPQKGSTDPTATARENIELAARIHGISRRDARARSTELLSHFALLDDADRLVRTYSGGMARKLDVAMGLVHRPAVLFLDEPTTGLDPQARAEMWAEISRLAAEEAITVLLTTHYLDEADHLADQVVIVDRGRVVAAGSPEQLKSELRGDTIHVGLESITAVTAAAGRLQAVAGVRDVITDGTTIRARADSGPQAVPAVLAALEDAGVGVVSVAIARPSLDDVYLRHAGRAYEAVA